MRINRLLMCKPTYFDIEYSINPWMDVNNRVVREKADAQWDHLHHTLRQLDVRVDLIEPAPGLPDMTFSGDCGMVVGRKFICSNFRYEQRQGEIVHYAKWMAAAGYDVRRISEQFYFEGLGDIVYYDDDVLFGYGPRSDPGAIAEVRKLVPELTVRGELRIADESFFHVALAVAFIAKDTIVYYPPAFSEETQAFIARAYPSAIAVTERDAREYFVCNNIPIGSDLILDNCSPQLEKTLASRGFRVLKCDMSEYKKSGGSVRCLVLKL